MNKILRFLFLNIYSFLLLFCGIILAILPFWKISYWLIIPQIFFCFLLLKNSYRVFYSYSSKKKEIEILYKRNINNFRPDTFAIFMKAPCGRLVVRCVLKDLKQKEKYKSLLIYKSNLIKLCKESLKPQQTIIRYPEDF